jgi:transcriptional regulator with XRE-family HTH domain
MSQTNQVITTLKRLLKTHGLTYADVASHLKLSEVSVKRQFSRESFNLKTLESICDLLQMEIVEVVNLSEKIEEKISQLTEMQEAELVKSDQRILVTISVFNHWTLSQIINTYAITEAECISHLMVLDLMALIKLMPQNKIKLIMARNFTWLPDGPIQQYFKNRVQLDFLNTNFNQHGEILRFQHAMLSPKANIRFQQRLKRLVQEFTDMHEDELTSPANHRYGTSLLIALRPWEPDAFRILRREPDNRVFDYT